MAAALAIVLIRVLDYSAFAEREKLVEFFDLATLLPQFSLSQEEREELWDDGALTLALRYTLSMLN